MNLNFLVVLALVFLAVWSLASYFFWRIRRTNRAQKAMGGVSPVFRLAEQWIMESQQKIEKLIESAEQPLSDAQHELLDLRLEAGRLPQGVKNLRMVREALNSPVRPAALTKTLIEIVGLYLAEEDYRSPEKDLVYLMTSLGEMPCVEVSGEGNDFSDRELKAAMARAAAGGESNQVAGGFIYFAREDQFKQCRQKAEWMEALRSRRLMAVDFKDLTALLASLQLSKDSDRLIQTFQEGIQTTRALVGEADKMGAALAALSADTLRVRTVLDGGTPSGFKNTP